MLTDPKLVESQLFAADDELQVFVIALHERLGRVVHRHQEHAEPQRRLRRHRYSSLEEISNQSASEAINSVSRERWAGIAEPTEGGKGFLSPASIGCRANSAGIA